MPIIDHKVLKQYSNGQGQNLLRLLFTDHTGETTLLPRVVIPKGVSLDEFMVKKTLWMEEKLVKWEIAAAPGKIRRGGNAVAIGLFPTHATDVEMVRGLVAYMRSEKDLSFVNLLSPLVDHMRSALSLEELAQTLDVSEEGVVTMFEKYEAILEGTATIGVSNLSDGWI